MTEISKAYEPQAVEEKWYQFWLDQNCFAADPARVSASRPAYSIVIPPPNVTGVLTMGHVLNNTLQDILARKARMDGKEVLWLPGTDHAGIATQNVVEKTLKKSGEIRHRDDLGREALVARIWEWKEKYGGIILQQLRALGASCDWTRTRFTMDPEYSRCVQKVFVDLYKKGLIYRGKRMVNWCPASLTALSDEEVTMKEQKGFMYHFRVQVVEKDGTPLKPATGLVADPDGRVWLTIATTRPETIPADTAVAVNAKDPRYTDLIGKHVIKALPLDVPKEQRLIPIIADEHVDFAFGTGVLKVTPAHDKADFDIGLRHQLPVIDVLTPDGKMTPEAGVDLAGLDRFAARKKAAEILEAAGTLAKTEPYVNNVGFSERADVPIEPRLSEQWFLKYPSVDQSKACVVQPGTTVDPISSGDAASPSGGGDQRPAEMHFYPERWAKVYDHWMGGIQDWCISRQLWWGHRIPVWTKESSYFREACAELHALEVEGFDLATVRTTNLETRKECTGENLLEREDEVSDEVIGRFRIMLCENFDPKQLGVLEKDLGFTQDPDVLDTWFSSWLWPFATMGWTGDKALDDKNPTLKTFYPTTDLVTGPDIIFFWVARMIMAGYEYMGDQPFRNVYFTGIIRDKQGRKMSKSLGNSPDPLDLIKQYGADALRFGVMRAAPLGQDILFDEQNVELGRNFCNKLWNACRFRQMVGGGRYEVGGMNDEQGQAGPASALSLQPSAFPVEGEINPALLTGDDKWILLKLDQAIREVTQAFVEYRFSDATSTLYRFFWSEYCDWYVESSKAVLRNAELGTRNFEGGTWNAELGTANAGAGRPETRNPKPEMVSTPDPQVVNKLAVIDFVLGHTLRLFHPFLPFITEELWHGMGFNQDLPEEQGGRTIMTSHWPKPFDADFRDFYALDDCYLESVGQKHELVTMGRNLRRESGIQAGKKVRYVFKPLSVWAPHQIEVIRLLLNAEAVEQDPEYQPKKGTPHVVSTLGELYLPTEGLIDVVAEKARLTKEKAKIEADLAAVRAKLANPNFAAKVPPAVLTEHEKRLIDGQARLAAVQNSLAALDG